MRAKLLSLGFATLCVPLAQAQYSPIPLTPGSFTQDIVVEKNARQPIANFCNVTIDQGTNNYGNTFFEQGFIPTLPELGLPPHGSTFTSLIGGHSYKMAPSYAANNCAFVGAANLPGTSTLATQTPSATLSVSDPSTAYTGISLLYAGGGSGLVNFTINYADGGSESSSLTTVDWFNTGTAAAWVAGGRLSPDGGGSLNTLRSTSQTKLFNFDYLLTHTGSAITNITFTYAGSTSYRAYFFGVSATTDSVNYNPVAAVSGFNADAVVEVGAPQQPFIQGCTVTFDGGPFLNGDTFYEQGFATIKGGSSQLNVGNSQGGTGTTGLPHPGTVLNSGSFSFQMPASYAGNCAFFVGNYAPGAISNGIYASPQFTNATVVLTTPAAYGGLAFLGTAGNGPMGVNYTVHYSDTTTETGTLSVPDWFGGAGTPVFITQGRANPYGPSLDNVGLTSAGKLFPISITLGKPAVAVNSVDLSWASGGRGALFAVSAQPSGGGNYSPIAVSGYNADPIIEKEQPFYPAGMFPYTTATMDQGTNNSANTWYERGWVTNGEVAATGLPAANTTFASLQAANRSFIMPPSYTGPNAVLIDTNHQVANITPVTPTAGTGFALLTAGASIGGANTMTNVAILQHANGVNETNDFFGYDWFNTAVAPAFISNGRVNSQFANLTSFYNNPQQPRLFETIFAMSEVVSPVTNIIVKYKLAGGTSWTTYVLAASATTAPLAPVLGPTILTPASTTDGSNFTAQATETGTYPFTNQWQFSVDQTNWVNLANGVGNFLNATSVVGAWSTVVLSNTNAAVANNGWFRLIASNAAGTTTNGAALLRVVSPLTNVVASIDTNSVVPFIPGGLAAADPAAEVIGHVVDHLVGTDPGKWFTSGPITAPPWNPSGFAVGFTVKPSVGKTTVSALRFYPANDSQQRDPADYTLEGSNDGGSTWTTISQGPISLPAARNAAASATVNALNQNQNLLEVRFANTTGYTMYRWSCTNVFDGTTANGMQIGEIEFLGIQTAFAPVITAQSGPTVKTYVGSSPTFFVQATGFPLPLTYQWYRNNGGGAVAITGATNATYTLANAQLSDSGAVFSCIVANTVGTAPSANSTLQVISAPTTAYATNIVHDTPMAYWRLDEGPDDGTGGGNNGVVAYDIAGGHNGYYTNAILQRPGAAVTDPDQAAYFSYSGGSPISPGNVDSCVEAAGGIDFATTNASANFSVEAWVQLDANLVAGGFVGGAGLVSKGTGGGGEQFCLDLGGTGNAFRFFVRDTSNGTHGPASSVVPEGGVWHHVVGVVDETHSNVFLYVDGLLSGTGAVNPTNGIRGSAAPVLIGARSVNATTNNNLPFFGTMDEVAIYNYALSSNQVLTHFYAAGIAPRFTAQPTNTTFSEGVTARFFAPFYGSPTLAAQWYQSTDGGVTFAPVAGQNTGTLTLPNVSASMNNYMYYLQVQNTYGTTNSATATLSVQSGPPILNVDIAPTTGVTYAGRSFSFSAQFGGTPPISYQWFHNGSPVSNGGRVSGATSNVLTVVNALTNDIGSWVVQASNSQGGPVPSSTATLHVETIPDFNGDGGGWSIQSSPAGRGIVGDLLTLTDGGGSEATAAFYQYPLYIGSFQAGFTYQDVSGPGGADGAAFVLQNDARGAAAIGGGGGGLGLSGITPSFALTFNIYNPNGQGVSFGVNGGTGAPFTSTFPLGLDFGDPINVSLLYSGGQLSVRLADPLAGTSFNTNVLVDLPAILGANSAYVGLTGGDGGVTSTQTITNFYFIPLPTIRAQNTSTNTVLLSWPSVVGGYAVLQKSTVGATGSWSASPATVNVVGTQNQAIVTPSGGQQFYRLVLQPIEP